MKPLLEKVENCNLAYDYELVSYSFVLTLCWTSGWVCHSSRDAALFCPFYPQMVKCIWWKTTAEKKSCNIPLVKFLSKIWIKHIDMYFICEVFLLHHYFTQTSRVVCWLGVCVWLHNFKFRPVGFSYNSTYMRRLSHSIVQVELYLLSAHLSTH